VVIIPEGTTSRGGLPILFRRAGFQAAVDAAAVIAPVSIDYLDRHDSRTIDPAFVGDDEFGSIWRVMCAARSWPTWPGCRSRRRSRTGVIGGSHHARAAGGTHGRISRALSPCAMGGLTVSPTDPRPAAPDRPSRAA